MHTFHTEKKRMNKRRRSTCETCGESTLLTYERLLRVHKNKRPPDKRARPGSKGLESTGEPVTCSNRFYRCNGSQGWRESGETVLSRAAEGSVILHATFPKRDFIKCFKSGTASAQGTQLLRFFLREHAKAAANHRLPLTTTILPSQSPADASTSCRAALTTGTCSAFQARGTARRRRGWPPPPSSVRRCFRPEQTRGPRPARR